MRVATGICLKFQSCPLLRCVLIVAVYSRRSLSSSDRDGNSSASPSHEISTSLPWLAPKSIRQSNRR